MTVNIKVLVNENFSTLLDFVLFFIFGMSGCTATEVIPTIEMIPATEMIPNHHRNDPHHLNDTGGHHRNDPRNIGSGIKRNICDHIPPHQMGIM